MGRLGIIRGGTRAVFGTGTEAERNARTHIIKNIRNAGTQKKKLGGTQKSGYSLERVPKHPCLELTTRAIFLRFQLLLKNIADWKPIFGYNSTKYDGVQHFEYE